MLFGLSRVSSRNFKMLKRWSVNSIMKYLTHSGMFDLYKSQFRPKTVVLLPFLRWNFTAFEILYMIFMEIICLRSATSFFRDAMSRAYSVLLLLSFFNIFLFLVFFQSQWLYCLASLSGYVHCKCLNETHSLVPPVSVVTKRTSLTTSAELNHLHFPLWTKYKIVFPPKWYFVKQCGCFPWKVLWNPV